MKFNQFVHINSIVVLLLLLCIGRAIASGPVEETLKSARKQFYAAIEDKKQIEPTIKLFERIAQVKPSYTGRTQVYIGALVALKGKHAFFPHTKLKWAKRGLAIMDNGLKKIQLNRMPAAGYNNSHRAQSNAYSTLCSFITCYHFGYHWEHHEYPCVPWWQLPTIRKMKSFNHARRFDRPVG